MIPQSEYLREELVILALQNHCGNTQFAAQELGLTRGELYGYMVRHPAVMEAKKQIKEALIDKAEDLLVQRMEQSDALLMFFLKTQAKDRGYEAAGEGRPATNVNVTVNARTLIAAMRNGLTDGSEDENLEEINLLPSTSTTVDTDAS